MVIFARLINHSPKMREASFLQKMVVQFVEKKLYLKKDETKREGRSN